MYLEWNLIVHTNFLLILRNWDKNEINSWDFATFKALWDKEDEIVQAFENDVEVTDRGTSACDIESMSASR